MTRLLALLLALAPSLATATPLDTIGTFCGTFPDQCRKGTTSLLAVRGTGTNAYYVLEADPTTGALPVNITGGSFSISVASDGPTGSAVPAQANYIGLSNAGTLIGAIGDSSGRQVVVGAGTAGTPAGGVVTVQGVASGTVLPANVSQFGGSAIATGTGAGGSGIPRVTVSSDSTVGLVAGSAIVGKVGIDQTTPGTTNGVQVNAALPAGTAILGKVGIDQTTPGTTNGVQVNAALPAGTAIIGKFGIDQTTPGTTNAVKATNFPTTVDTDTGASGASTLRAVLSTRQESVTTPLAAQLSNGSAAVAYGSGASGSTVLRVVAATDSNPGAGRAYADSVRYTYVTAAVGTVSWVQLIASTAATINCINLFDSSGQTLELGTGAAASETRVLIIPPGGLDGCVPLKIASGTRVAIRALSATTGAIGEIDITGFN